jgi:hypothetical protein
LQPSVATRAADFSNALICSQNEKSLHVRGGSQRASAEKSRLRFIPMGVSVTPRVNH